MSVEVLSASAMYYGQQIHDPNLFGRKRIDNVCKDFLCHRAGLLATSKATEFLSIIIFRSTPPICALDNIELVQNAAVVNWTLLG